jgi:predicted TIM-barrel fold metal-dependent hydrolase
MQKTQRRDFLKVGGAVLATPLACSFPNLNLNAAAIKFSPYSGKRFDFHGHIPPEGYSVSHLIDTMDHIGIDKIALSARGIKNQPLVLQAHRKHPERVVPFASANYLAFHERKQQALNILKKNLGSGRFKGVGEIIVRYFARPKLNEPEQTDPPNSIFMKQVVDMLGEYGAPAFLHIEPDTRIFPQLEELFAHNRKANLVWAHMGSVANDHRHFSPYKELFESDTEFFLYDMMKRHPNLYTDISAVQATQVRWGTGNLNSRRPTITDENGLLLQKYKKIIKDFPDRVLFGLDAPYKQNWDSPDQMKSWVEWANVAVSEFDEDTQKMVMYQNAERLT